MKIVIGWQCYLIFEKKTPFWHFRIRFWKMSDTCRNIAFYNDVFTRREFNNKIENVFEQHLVFFNYHRYFANFPINATFLPVYDFQKLNTVLLLVVQSCIQIWSLFLKRFILRVIELVHQILKLYCIAFRRLQIQARIHCRCLDWLLTYSSFLFHY